MSNEYAKKEALKQFVLRATMAKDESKIKNEDLHAGEPMYYYCKACGIFIEFLPEGHLFSPFQHCSQCVGLISQGWLDDAKVLVD